MSWHVDFTRFATVHMVKKQDQVNSCGIACVLVINFKIKKGLMAQGASAGSRIAASGLPGGGLVGAGLAKAAVGWAVKSEQEIYRIYGQVVGTVYDGTTYSDGMRHPEVLERIGLGRWECVNVGQNGVVAALRRAVGPGQPCIAHVAWLAGGAHFVVVDDVVQPGQSVFVLVNDPGDGQVVVTKVTGDGALSYRNNAGVFSGWIIRRR
ncbi:hypothetical protein HB662_14470 [Roseomonas frigidaquae]|uniref:Peptidase C39 domain-containing protein n=1 Tax=Falsiroseomonas frigidaquae TaxID=487318 RepID=A0ABX1F0Y1_9PROT|nr:hypothetical protein [Falsiroseomonas frigidaquae]NKE45992.1 hypothetical protein [Falsiroseomonas frigidaquae]